MHKGGERKPDINASSLLDLKAELFRKQEEFKQQKLQNQETGAIKGKHTVSNKKPSLFSKKNAGVSERAEKDFEGKQEEEDVFLRSKKSLESKAKLYEKISSGVELPDEDGSGLFLVDFQKKVLDDEEQRRQKERVERERLEEEEERRLLVIPVPEPQNEDEEWVDYVDAYGRTRRCLKQDLPTVQERDKLLLGRQRDKDTLSTQHLLSDDMARELERQRWEQAEIAQMEQEKQGPIHYADVRHNEVRTHGVGFYKFNAEEEVRQAQMEQLQNLRDQTKTERSKSDRVKEKRKAALAARLAKVKQRKREKLGLPEEEEEPVEEEEEEGEIGPLVTEQVKEPQILTRDDSWRTTTPSTREWDRGKHVSMEQSGKAWLEKQRAERETEFAPPSFYYGNQSNQTGGRCLADIEGNNQNKTESPSLKDTMTSTDSCYNDQDKGGVEQMIGEQLTILRTSLENNESEDNQEMRNRQQQQLRKEDSKMYNNDSNISQVVVAPTARIGLYNEATHTTSLTSAQAIPPMLTVPLPVNFYAPPPVNVHLPLPVNIHAPPQVNMYEPPLVNFYEPPPVNINFPPPGYATMPSNYFPTGAQNFSVPPPPLSFPSSSPDSQSFTQTHDPFVPPTFLTASQNFNVPPPPLLSQVSSATNAASYPYVPATDNTTTEQPPVKKVVPKMSIVDTRLMGND